jgi:hypothetical protein
MNAEKYKKVISDPWSWKYTSDHLYLAANDFCEIFQERVEAMRKYSKEQLDAKLKRQEEDLRRLEEEIEQLKAGNKSSPNRDFMKTDYSKVTAYDDFSKVKAYGDYSNGTAYDNSDTGSLFKLKDYTHILPIYMMLMGMAVENLVKGIKVARVLKNDNTIVKRASLKELGIWGHTAPDLIKDLGIIITDDKLVYEINEYLEWAGRYSAPSNKDKTILTETVMQTTLVEFEEEKVFENLARIFKQLEDIFYEEVKDPFIEDLRQFQSIR